MRERRELVRIYRTTLNSEAKIVSGGIVTFPCSMSWLRGGGSYMPADLMKSLINAREQHIDKSGEIRPQ